MLRPRVKGSHLGSGAQLDELYITTARQRLSEDELKAQPLAGSLFVVRPGVKGLPEGRYRGDVNQLGAAV